MDKVYDTLGTTAGTFDGPEGKPLEAVGLLLPTETEGEEDTVWMTLPAAKALLIDLRDAIEACVSHQNGESPDKEL